MDNIVTLLSNNFLTNTPTKAQYKQLQLRNAFIPVSDVLKNNQPLLPPHYNSGEPRVKSPFFSLVSKPLGPPARKMNAPLPRVFRPVQNFLTHPQLGTTPLDPRSSLKQWHPPSIMRSPLPVSAAQWTLNHIYDKQGKKLNIDKLITMPGTKEI